MNSLFILRFIIDLPENFKLPVFIVFGVVLAIISFRYEKIKKWISDRKKGKGQATGNDLNDNTIL